MGLVIFAIILLIQFLVVTKGATRISEVAARFALDGMPGRQMAIDADVNAGIIDQQEAHRRREESRDNPISTQRWTVPVNSCAEMPLPAWRSP